jgi:hypothetical protein
MKDWDWQLFPKTETFLNGLLRSFIIGNRYADVMRGEIEDTTSTRFIDWVDSIELPERELSGSQLIGFGYEKEPGLSSTGDVYVNPRATFFPIVLRADREHALSIKVNELDKVFK